MNTVDGQRGKTAAHLAAEGGRGEALKVLLAAGVDVNAKDGVSMVKRAMIVTRDEGVGGVSVCVRACCIQSTVEGYVRVCVRACLPDMGPAA